MTNIFIKTNNVGVEFPIYNSSHRSLKKAFLRASTGGKIAADAGSRVTVRALDEINLALYPGDRIGLIGGNGAGKTTLLRVLSQVYAPTSGTISLNGRIVSLLDISLGMEAESTGYENIILRGILMGFTLKEIRARAGEIIEFSGLGEYINLPMRTYSSGMVLRLAFSVSTSMHADILLMDEWLSVGDAEFSDRASKRLKEVVDRSSILVLATHSESLLASVCNRKLTLSGGKVVCDEPLTQEQNEEKND